MWCKMSLMRGFKSSCGLSTIVVTLLSHTVLAGRGGPQPLVASFLQGYGVVAGTVVSLKPAPEPTTYDVTFNIDTVVAQPAAGDPLPVKSSEEIHVILGMGYALPVEKIIAGDRIVPGTKYYLTIKFDPEKQIYSHVSGGGSARETSNFDAESMDGMKRIRELAATTLPGRFEIARRFLIDPKSNGEVRRNCQVVLRHVADQDTPPSERAATIAFLRERWADVSIRQDWLDNYDLDDTLRTVDESFRADSDARIDGWLKLTLAPFDQQNPDALFLAVTTRWNSYLHGRLLELALQSPDKLAPTILKEMNIATWPMEFRVGLAWVLEKMYQEIDQPDPSWEAALQAFYPKAFDNADGWVLRLMVPAITQGEEEPKYSVKRRYVSREQTWEAIKRALVRMRAELKAEPQSQNALSAVRDLEEAIGKGRGQ